LFIFSDVFNYVIEAEVLGLVALSNRTSTVLLSEELVWVS